MRFEKIGDDTHIYCGGNESEEEVLVAVVRASYELSRPAGLGWIHFEDEQGISRNDARRLVDITDEHVVWLDYVKGRQCKTFIVRVDKGHFKLDGYQYERDRGSPAPMLLRAQELLVGKEATDGISSEHMYQGEALTKRFKEYGFHRRTSESDWEFRKRIFPEFYRISSDRAVEFLMGASAADWIDIDKFLVMDLAMRNPSHEELVRFANGFATDPILHREQNR